MFDRWMTRTHPHHAHVDVLVLAERPTASPDGASATDYQVQIQTPKQITGGYASTQVEIQFAQP